MMNKVADGKLAPQDAAVLLGTTTDLIGPLGQ